MTSPPESLQPLAVFDIDAASTQSLARAIYVSPSTDGRYVAFEGSDGKVAVWSEATAAVTEFEAAGGPLHLSPDGQKVLYLDGQQNLRVLVLGQASSALVASSIPCPISGMPLGPATGNFSEDSSAVAAVAPVAGPCTSAAQPEAVHLFDIASGKDQSYALPAGPLAPSGFVLDVASSAVAYELGANALHVWSPALGDVSLGEDPSGDGAIRYAALGQDGNRGVFVLEGGDPRTAWLWDRATGAQSLATIVSDLNHPFVAKLDARSGVALAYDGTLGAFVIARPGAMPTPWVHGVNDHFASASGRAFTVSGTSGIDTGLFALSFASGNASFLEGGHVVAASDTDVYFVAADGLCEIAGP
jgi:hypothetical protein